MCENAVCLTFCNTNLLNLNAAPSKLKKKMNSLDKQIILLILFHSKSEVPHEKQHRTSPLFYTIF